MKNQFNIILKDSSDYEKSDLIQTQFYIKDGIAFMILDSDYGDKISLRIRTECVKTKPVNFYKLQIIDNFILNQARHLVCIDSSIPMKPVNVIYRSNKCTKPSVYYAPSKTLYMAFGVNNAIHITCSSPCLVMDNDQKYYITFDNDRYIILVDENYKDPSKLPGISFAKLPLEKEQIKNVPTFNSTEDARIFFNKLMNKYLFGEELPESNADVCIILRAFRHNCFPISIDLFNIRKLMSTSDEEED